QVSPSSSTLRILSHTLYHEGIQGLYRGYKSTVLREKIVPKLKSLHKRTVNYRISVMEVFDMLCEPKADYKRSRKTY
uniref:Uncharacterized protein n=1 Tax=Buteo japonicus TaxID=224669 RepID=A0A8C0HH77_9AVES